MYLIGRKNTIQINTDLLWPHEVGGVIPIFPLFLALFLFSGENTPSLKLLMVNVV